MQKLNYNQYWAEYFSLCETSPSGLARIKNYLSEDIEIYNVGTEHFKKNKNAHAWILKFQKKTYLIHRIIWVMAYGSIEPNLVIDHLDGNPFNNKIENLSLKTLAGNSRNKCQHTNNKTGVTGVSLTNKGKGSYYYTAHWYEIDGLMRVKHFSISKLGDGKAKNLATAYRDYQIDRLQKEGAGYTERHGR